MTWQPSIDVRVGPELFDQILNQGLRSIVVREEFENPSTHFCRGDILNLLHVSHPTANVFARVETVVLKDGSASMTISLL
jgi:hypothetical protein